MGRLKMVVRLYLKSGQVIRFYASEVTVSKDQNDEYTKVQSGAIKGEALKGFTPQSIAAWTTQPRRWWQF